MTPSFAHSHLFYAATSPTQTAHCVTSICISTPVRPLARRHTTHSPTFSPAPLRPLVDWRPRIERGPLLPHSWEDGHHPPSRCRRYRRLPIPAGSSFSRPVWTASSGKPMSDIALRSSASGMSASGRPLRAHGLDGSCRKCHGTVLRRRRQTLLRPRPLRAASGLWPCGGASEPSHRILHSPLRGDRHLVSLRNQIVGDLRCPPPPSVCNF
jgi:hypothetical protein